MVLMMAMMMMMMMTMILMMISMSSEDGQTSLSDIYKDKLAAMTNTGRIRITLT